MGLCSICFLFHYAFAIWLKINFIVCGLSDYMHGEEAYYDWRAKALAFYCSSSYFFCSQSMFLPFSVYGVLHYFIDIFMQKQCMHHVFEQSSRVEFYLGMLISALQYCDWLVFKIRLQKSNKKEYFSCWISFPFFMLHILKRDCRQLNKNYQKLSG